MDKIKVIAKEGTQCPKENAPREYITDNVAEEVPASVFYLRLINDGSLIREADVRSQEPGVGSQEPEVRSEEPEVKPETSDPAAIPQSERSLPSNVPIGGNPQSTKRGGKS